MSFFSRVVETTLVNLTAGAASKVAERVAGPGLEKAKQQYRQWRGLPQEPEPSVDPVQKEI